MNINKLEAARRQFSTAIALIFSKGDAVAIHTLISAASTIVSDLVEAHCPDRSWDRFAQKANGLSELEYFQIIRAAQNFFKHANTDPDGIFDFEPADSDSIGFWITLNLGELGCRLTMQESMFQLWYIACYPQVPDETSKLDQTAFRLFGNLRDLSRAERIEAGGKVMEAEMKK